MQRDKNKVTGNKPITGKAESSALLDLLICPACYDCDQTPVVHDGALVCPSCQTEFPLFKRGDTQIPWLFHQPQEALLDWKARLNGYLHTNTREQTRLLQTLETTHLSATARKRIEHLLHATTTQKKQILHLIEPLGLEQLCFENADPATLLRSKLPKTQSLTGYYDNIFRDWCWNNGETEIMFQGIQRLLESSQRKALGRLLTLGAGACRLSYDLHNYYKPRVSVALDLNPLLLLLASDVISGHDTNLFEFPIAPLDGAAYAVNQTCTAPRALKPDTANPFYFALGDGLNPPFKPACFDTVLTPWFIDIISQNLADFIPTVNRLLRKGGVWLNTGSLAFFHKHEDWRHSGEEVLEHLEQNGFEVLSVQRENQPYLQSPSSAHGRMERVFSFCARKTEHVLTPVRYDYLPDWLTHTEKPIPNLAEFIVASSDHLLRAQVLATLDGKRSIEGIGDSVAKTYGLPKQEAVAAVRRILLEVFESNLNHQAGSLDGHSGAGGR